LGIVTLPVTLLDLPTDELTATAREVRDTATGTRVTYSPKVFVPLTRLCRDRCGYCTFATAPHHIASPYLSPDEVLAIAAAGAEAGCHEALFTLGEAPEDRYVEAADWLGTHGYASTVDYLVEIARRVLEETGLLPHANAGAVSREDLARLRTAADGVQIRQTDPDELRWDGAPRAEWEAFCEEWGLDRLRTRPHRWLDEA
jgi:FO synthase